jgi:RNA polymerase primary sigma factor
LFNKTFARLEQEYEREPNADELANALELSPDDIKDAMRNTGRHVSMDAPLASSDENASTMYDVMQSDDMPSPENTLITESLRKEIERALCTLTSREADVVRLYFGLSGEHALTLEEIGEKFELTRERVRQIKEKAIRRLKHTSRSKLLKTYLG